MLKPGVVPNSWRVEYTLSLAYDIIQCRGLFKGDVPQLPEAPDVRRRLAVIDRRVWDLYEKQIPGLLSAIGGEIAVHLIDVSEASKNRKMADQITDAAIECGLSRLDEFVVIGGGVIIDCVGVAAGDLRKGTSYVAVPTTLIGQIDAGHSAKRAIWQVSEKTGNKKNFVGHYHPPRIVLNDPDVLGTLDENEVRAGMAESKKVAEMADGELFELLEAHGRELIETRLTGAVGDEVLSRSIAGILEQIANDPFEENLRRWPDWGHTISPHLEERTGMRHGMAVSVCCSLGAAHARWLGRITDGEFRRMIGLATTMGLPVWHPLLESRAFLETALSSTALTRHGTHSPVPAGIGRHTFVNLDLHDVQQAVSILRQNSER